MPNTYDQRKLIEQLIQDREAELMPHEINDILEKELAKPADEVDMQLVEELLNLLDTEGPTAADKEACWQSIQRERKPQKRFKWKKTINRVAAIAAMIVVVFFVSFESAKAFRWTFLLKLLAPVAETFGIYSASTIESTEPVANPTDMMDVDTEYEQMTYASIEQMPTDISGYQIFPAWVPERFAFVQGSTYEDPDMAYCSLFYRANEDTLGINTFVYYTSDAVFSYEYERTLTEPRSEDVNGILVSYYFNSEEGELSCASWIDGDAHYHVVGSIADEELRQVVRGMIEK